MPAPLYRAPAADACAGVALDPFVALYDRRSGLTHLLAEPAPQLLDILAEGPLTLAALRARLGRDFEVEDASEAALTARLAELAEAGLVEIG